MTFGEFWFRAWDVKPVIVVGKQITLMIAIRHVMLAVPVVLGCHFMLSRTK
jgi:hypothetical protein